MSIKQSILTLCLFFGVSFNVFADSIKLTSVGKDGNVALECTGLSIGSIVSKSSPPSVGGKIVSVGGFDYECKRAGFLGNTMEVLATRRGSGRDVWGQVHGQVVQEPFCSRPDTIQEMNNFASSCAAQGDGYVANIVCRDEDEYLSMNCDAPPPPPDECTPDSPDWPNCKPPTECTPDSADYPACCDESNNYCDNPPPEECTIFSPNWPECSGDTDIDPDTGDDLGDPDKPPGGGSGDPDPDKPEPDVENNSESLGAISDLNKDMNNQLTAINNDLNRNHAESKSALDALKASVDLNTDTVVDSSNHLKGVIESQTGTLSDIGNKTNGLLTSANHLLKNGFADLSGDLSGLKNSNEKGFSDVVNALDELGNKQVDSAQHGAPEGLYTSAEYNAMLGEVTQLKEEYKSVLNDFKRYFNFNSGVNSGEFNAHTLSLNWHGNSINQQNQVMTTLRDNAGIIAAVVLFCFGVAGIRVLVGAL